MKPEETPRILRFSIRRRKAEYAQRPPPLNPARALARSPAVGRKTSKTSENESASHRQWREKAAGGMTARPTESGRHYRWQGMRRLGDIELELRCAGTGAWIRNLKKHRENRRYVSGALGETRAAWCDSGTVSVPLGCVVHRPLNPCRSAVAHCSA